MANVFSLGSYRRALGQVQLTHDYDCDITVAPTFPGATAFPENVKLRIKSSAIPENTPEVAPVEIAGHTWNANTRTITTGELNWEFHESTGMEARNYFEAWLDARWGKTADGTSYTGARATDAQLKATVVVRLLNETRDPNAPTKTWTLEGAMPKINAGAGAGEVGLYGVSLVWEYDQLLIT